MEQSVVLKRSEGQLSDLYRESLLWAERAANIDAKASRKAS
jgi:hypothetical protein